MSQWKVAQLQIKTLIWGFWPQEIWKWYLINSSVDRSSHILKYNMADSQTRNIKIWYITVLNKKTVILFSQVFNESTWFCLVIVVQPSKRSHSYKQLQYNFFRVFDPKESLPSIGFIKAWYHHCWHIPLRICRDLRNAHQLCCTCSSVPSVWLQEDGTGLAAVPKGCPERQPLHTAAFMPIPILEVWYVHGDWWYLTPNDGLQYCPAGVLIQGSLGWW